MQARQIKTHLWLVFVMLVSFSCVRKPALLPSLSPVENLRQELDQIFAEPDFINANWGVAIQSLDNGQYLYLHDADKRYLPASNMKLLTTSASLGQLGIDFRYQTVLYADGVIGPDSVLTGNLILAGAGDPTFGSRYFNSKNTQIFEDWADSLRALGIRAIHGNIIGDDNIFDDEILGTGWAWDDESEYYSAQIGGICFFDNCVNVYFSTEDTVKARARFRLEPETEYLEIYQNTVTIAAPEEDGSVTFNRRRGTNLVQVQGSVPKSTQEYQDWVTVDNPTRYAVTVLKETLAAKKIAVIGQGFDIDELSDFHYKKDRPVAVYTSAPLIEIVRIINKISQNLYAEQVFRSLGINSAQTNNETTGREALKAFLQAAGINTDAIRIADGSGLSRKNLVSPRQVVTLLRYLDKQPYGPAFVETLPIAGIDGTLKGRMVKTRAEKNVRAKTGTLENVRSLSGFITTLDGERLAFSMLLNNFMVPVSVATRIQDLVCERLANFSRQPH